VTLAAAVPEGGVDHVGRAEEQGVGAAAVAVGDDPDVAAGDAGQQAVELARIEQGTVAREQHDPLRALDFGPGDPRLRGLDVAGILGVRHHLRAHSRGQLLRDRVSRHHDQPLDRARLADRLEDVGDHRPGELAPALPLEAGGEALLGGAEALDGQDGGGAHREASVAA
jgi:hypothetical protein